MRPSILVVDDDAEGREALMALLSEDGFEVAGAPDGTAALARLRNGPRTDVILLDLIMPEKDGWQFRIEQKRDPAIASIPVVAISGDGSAKAAAIDANVYLRKPYEYSALLAVLRDVVERDRLALLDRMASLGTLAGGIAHEINNPLTYMLANLQRVEQELPLVVRAEVGGRLRKAVEGAERIRDIVRNVVTFAHAGGEHRVLVDVQRVLDMSIDLVLSEVQRHARLVKEYSYTPLVVATPGLLAQLFLHLLVNAAQAFSEDDPWNNVIRVVSGTSPAGQALVEISDTGPGVPPEIRPRIFDPFYTTKQVGRATGLGLSVCYGIVQALDGRISLQSEPGLGTTFRVTLPPCLQ